MFKLRIHRIIWAVSGLAFVALFGLGFIFANVLPTESYPSPFAPSTQIESYFTNSDTQVQMMSFLYSLAALMLLIFAVYVATFVRRSVDDTGALSRLVSGGGILAAAFAQLSALCLWVLAQPATVEVPALLRAVHDLAYLTGGPAHVLAFAPLLGASSIALLNRPILPGWINWLGIAAAALSFLSVTALLWTPATLLLPLARALAFVWISAVSLLVLVRPQPIEQRWPLMQTPQFRRHQATGS